MELVVGRHQIRSTASTGGVGERCDLVGEALEARRLAAVTHRAADVAGVHALEDAGQLPVAEGDVEVDAARRRGRTRSA